MRSIYVSSTLTDLMTFRSAIISALRQMGHHVICMEDYGAADERPLSRCLADVDRCEIYVGVLAWRYGYRPLEGNPTSLSITELEYRSALESGKICLLFLLNKSQPWPPAYIDRGSDFERIKAFRDNSSARHLVSFFSTEQDLTTQVVTAVYNIALNASRSTSSLASELEEVPRLIPPEEFQHGTIDALLSSVTVPYALYCSNAYGNIRILSMPGPLALQQLYTRAKVIEGAKHTHSLEVSDLLAASTASSGKPSQYAIHIARSNNKVVLLGGPGSGKSTFLKFILNKTIAEVEHGKRGELKLPVYIPLNSLAGTLCSLRQEIEHVFLQCNVGNPQQLVSKLLEFGRLHLLLDGLDELSSQHRHAVLAELIRLSDQYFDCGYIVTCRSASYQYWLTNFSHFELSEFSWRAIVVFVKKWYATNRPKARSLIQILRERPHLSTMCKTPLLLSIVCIAFDDNVNVSTNRAESYKDAIDVLLRRWDASRSIAREDAYRQLTLKRREDLLGELAAQTFSRGGIVFSSDRAQELISRFMASLDFHGPELS